MVWHQDCLLRQVKELRIWLGNIIFRIKEEIYQIKIFKMIAENKYKNSSITKTKMNKDN